MEDRKNNFEKAVLKGEGNVFVSAGLSKELFSSDAGETVSVNDFANEARRLAQQIKTGDNGPVLDKLASQLHLLDVLFTRTTQLAVQQSTPERMTALLNMAMKIQNNTRRTASTINELTHPKVANNYIRTETANVATNQQINYSEKNLENELNTGDIHEMDRRSPSKTGRANQRMEALVEVDRSKDSRG
jgi:hypothetical protein